MIFGDADLLGVFFLLLSINAGELCAQSSPFRVRFLGPDSGHLDVKSLQVCPDQHGHSRIGAMLSHHSAVLAGGQWTYDRVGGVWFGLGGPFFDEDGMTGFWLSPWDDEVTFLANKFWDGMRGLPASKLTMKHLGKAVSSTGFYTAVVDSMPKVLFLPGAPSLILAKSVGLDASSDSGKTWAFFFNGAYNSGITSADLIVSDIATRELLRVGLVNSPNGFGIEASTDLGRTWLRRHNFPEAFTGLPALHSRLYVARGKIYLRSGVAASEGAPGTAIRMSTDGGASWTLRGLFPLNAGLAVDTANGQRLFVVYADTICVSWDGGQHWSKTGLGMQQVNFSMAVLDPETGELIVASDGQGIYAIGGIPTSTTAAIPVQEDVYMGSPYPNPAHGELFIPVSLRSAEPVLVTITDALGRRVATVHDGILPVGMQQLHWNSAGMAKGVYAVRLVCDGRVHLRRIALQ
jgi:hypothetical protein